jgi:exopolyphosphatase / guanosine-5'-triphosphate,3'-diphosphate pyrophosphatase
LNVPLRFGAVDIGSNSIKLRVVEIAPDKTRKTLSEARYPVRLGDSFANGRISATAIDATVETFTEVAHLFSGFRVDYHRAVATSAVREAVNRNDLVQAIRSQTGISVEIITGKEEARLLGWGVRPDMQAGAHNLLIDVGGGSTEVIYTRTDLTLSGVASVRLGAVRLRQMLESGARVSKKDALYLRSHIADVLEKSTLPVAARNTHVIGVAGTMRALLDAIHHRHPSMDMEFTRDELRDLIEEMYGLDLEMLEKKLGIEKRRGQIIVPGALIVEGLMELYDISRLSVSPRGLRDGLLDELIASTVEGFLPAYTSADYALAIGDKYEFDRSHAMHVAKLALQLYDQLEQMHKLPPHWRPVLYAASLLHDIGQFINYSRHHKHSYYIILNEELPGLTQPQQQAAAVIARYHRKSFPSEKHPEFAAFSPDVRRCVEICTALLRIAEALDRQHRQLVTSISVASSDNLVKITIRARSEVFLEVSAAEKNAELFSKCLEAKIVFESHVNGKGSTRT